MFLILLFVELLSYFFLTIKDDTTFPNYNFGKRTHYLDIDEKFGAWHIPDSKYKHKRSCFNVEYSFNSIGARDEEFQEYGKNRIFLLGDSSVEGYGLEKLYNMDKLLEKYLNKNVLNFGTSGYFGTTQQRLLYEKYEDKYEHDTVVQVITVANDFEDDDFEFGKNYAATKNRYRPYLIKDNNDEYKFYYSGTKLSLEEASRVNLKDILFNYTHFYHFLKYFKSLSVSKKRNDMIMISPNYYFDYKEHVLDIFKFNFLKINEIAKTKQRRYIIVLLPDFNHLKLNSNQTEFKLSKDLESFLSLNSIGFLDLISKIQQGGHNIQKMYNTNDHITCDGHQNIFGSKIISSYIAEFVKN